MTTTPTPTFTDRPFVRSHMKNPRGRGTWAFQASATDAAFDRDLTGDIFWCDAMTPLAAAKKAAAAHFAGTTRFVAVLP